MDSLHDFDAFLYLHATNSHMSPPRVTKNARMLFLCLGAQVSTCVTLTAAQGCAEHDTCTVQTTVDFLEFLTHRPHDAQHRKGEDGYEGSDRHGEDLEHPVDGHDDEHVGAAHGAGVVGVVVEEDEGGEEGRQQEDPRLPKAEGGCNLMVPLSRSNLLIWSCFYVLQRWLDRRVGWPGS